jgi:hypothetical protein
MVRTPLLAAAMLASVACRTADLPPLPDRSLAAAIRRGATAPDPDALREAVVRLYLNSLPRQSNPVIPAATELCVGIDSKVASLIDELIPPVPPPPGMPPDALEPSPAFLARFAGEHPAVVAGSSCAEPLTFMMELQPIRRWSFGEPEFEVPAYVGYGPVGSIQTYTAELRNGSWVVTSCRTAIGICDERPE